ncbi:MAG: type 1 glutamine amidotransferase [Firmicutes bacterium]|nr:type 1 glutamine amidotransferase [Bacillota bacterium]
MRLLMIQHVACEGPGLLADVLSDDGWELEIKLMDTPGAVLPNQLDDYQALVILGGPMGAYEEISYPYLIKVQDLIREAVIKNIPTIGICLGGQLIARVLGAQVAPNPSKEIGWLHVHLLPAGEKNRLFMDLPPMLSVFQWHGDSFALPAGAVLLASSELCPNQAFVYNHNIWALQFHLEVTPAMIKNWSEIYGQELADFGGPGAADILVRNTQARWDGMRPWREQFLSNLALILHT